MTDDTRRILENLMNDESSFGVTGWYSIDLENALERGDVQPTAEAVELLRDLINEDYLLEVMVSAGWTYIDCCVDDLLRYHGLQVYEVTYERSDGAIGKLQVKLPYDHEDDELDAAVASEVESRREELGIGKVILVREDHIEIEEE